MKVSTALIQVSDDGSLSLCDVVEYQGSFWLAPKWDGDAQQGIQWPALLIELDDRFPLEPAPAGYQADLLIKAPLSRDTLEGGTAQGLVVIRDARHLVRSVGSSSSRQH